VILLWHMPFTIMAFAVVGRTAERAVTIGRRRRQERAKA